MNLRDIDLNLLPVFEVIYVERSLARASVALHITPPAVSNALARLRSHFDDPLFVREGRGVKPTSAAEALIPVVREALDRLRQGLELKREFRPATSSRLFNLSVRDAGAFILAAAIAKRIEREAPNVRLHLSQTERDAIPTELASGRLDLAIDIAELRGGELQHEIVLREPYVCVMRADHPSAPTKLTLERYLALRHIAVSSRRAGRGMVEEQVRRLGHRLRPALRLPHYMPAFQIVRVTDFVLAAPAALARAADLKSHVLPFAVPELTLAQHWSKASAQDPGVRWLRHMIMTAGTEAGSSDTRARRA